MLFRSIVVQDILEVCRLYEKGHENVVTFMSSDVSEAQLETFVPAVGQSGRVSVVLEALSPNLIDRVLMAGLWLRRHPNTYVARAAAQ